MKNLDVFLMKCINYYFFSVSKIVIKVPLGEDGEELYQQQVNYENNDYVMMNKLNQEGFFDQEESEDDFNICKLNHDKHYPITLSLRIILKLASKKENVAIITLKLIDLFCQKGNEEIIERF